MTTKTPDAHSGVLDINAVFRSGGRAVEFLEQINKASLVMLCETGIMPHEHGTSIARGIAKVAEDTRAAFERTGVPRRSADYLDYEPRLVAAVGPDASRLHSGRSRQDIAATIARMNLRDGLMQEIDALMLAREEALALAAKHIDTIIPAYTHGVQAQPTTFAHYLLALIAALTRETERLREAYARVNRNPLGTGALATSSFPLDRRRLAVLLGFEGQIENAYDANHLAPVDSALDVASALAIAATQIGQFAQDLHAQYADTQPWFLLGAGELTGVSSIMPQKRNPVAIEQLRAQSSIMLGDMQTVFLLSHNARIGMFDYRMYDPVPCGRPLQVFKLLQQVLGGLVVDKERALAEVRADYSTTTEIADALMQRADVPFRIGHDFASKITDFGRGNRLRLGDIPYAEAQRIYTELTQQPLPLSEDVFREVISPEYMVSGRKGLGGPQPAEVRRMLEHARGETKADRDWLRDRQTHLSNALASLEKAFTALATQ
ncbi:MAG: argininosuccinate lyase [Proteobacteria bacterium]|nr:argininosuccinate lyase [Pseudomonadota bacterium]